MSAINKVFLSGHIGTHSRSSIVGSAPKVNLSLATSSRWMKDGVLKEETQWHYLEFWNSLAQYAETRIRKGDHISLVGQLRYNEYTDKEGIKQRSTVIRVEQVDILHSPQQTSSEQAEVINNY